MAPLSPILTVESHNEKNVFTIESGKRSTDSSYRNVLDSAFFNESELLCKIIWLVNSNQNQEKPRFRCFSSN